MSDKYFRFTFTNLSSNSLSICPLQNYESSLPLKIHRSLKIIATPVSTNHSFKAAPKNPSEFLQNFKHYITNPIYNLLSPLKKKKNDETLPFLKILKSTIFGIWIHLFDPTRSKWTPSPASYYQSYPQRPLFPNSSSSVAYRSVGRTRSTLPPHKNAWYGARAGRSGPRKSIFWSTVLAIVWASLHGWNGERRKTTEVRRNRRRLRRRSCKGIRLRIRNDKILTKRGPLTV